MGEVGLVHSDCIRPSVFDMPTLDADGVDRNLQTDERSVFHAKEFFGLSRWVDKISSFDPTAVSLAPPDRSPNRSGQASRAELV